MSDDSTWIKGSRASSTHIRSAITATFNITTHNYFIEEIQIRVVILFIDRHILQDNSRTSYRASINLAAKKWFNSSLCTHYRAWLESKEDIKSFEQDK